MKIQFKRRLADYEYRIAVKFTNRDDIDRIFDLITVQESPFYRMPWLYMGENVMVLPPPALELLRTEGFSVTEFPLRQRGSIR